MSNRPKVFIGSSVESLSIAYSVQQNLTHETEATVWDQGVFELSLTSIESLVSLSERVDFAIFVFSPDDITKIRKKQYLTVRDNVIFELGLFVGKIGRHRTFVLTPNSHKFHIPTDLLGITTANYDTLRSDGSYQAATGPACHQIRQQIKKHGALVNSSATSEGENSNTEFVYPQIENDQDWYSLIKLGKYQEIIDGVAKELRKPNLGDKEKGELELWNIFAELRLNKRKGKILIANLLKDKTEKLLTYTGSSAILLYESELQLAIEIIDKGLEKWPENIILLSRKSEYYFNMGDIEKAISFIKLTGQEDKPELKLKLIDYYKESKNFNEAIKLATELYKADNESEVIMESFASVALELDKNAIALYLLNKLTKTHPQNAQYWGRYGNACVALDLNNKAMIAYKKAEELSGSKESWIQSNIGNLLKNRGFYSEAKNYLEQALELDKNSEYAYNRMSLTLKMEEEEDEKCKQILRDGLNDINSKNLIP